MRRAEVERLVIVGVVKVKCALDAMTAASAVNDACGDERNPAVALPAMRSPVEGHAASAGQTERRVNARAGSGEVSATAPLVSNESITH